MVVRASFCRSCGFLRGENANMPRPKIHRSAADRVAAHDDALRRSGGRVTKVRLSSEASRDIDLLIEAGFGGSLNEVLNRAVTLARRCYVPTKNG